ncbi:MAG: helix-turn-helix domain-containing protein [Polyangia bacterium]
MTTQLDPATLRRLVRARDLLHDCHAEAVTLDAMARAAGLSPTFFLRRFTAAFGTTPHRYLTELRLERARRLLARGSAVTDVCFDVGFHSLGSFSSLFRRHVGVSPRDWQRQVRAVVGVPDLWPAVFIPGCFLMMYAQSNFGEAPATAGR